MAAFSVKSKKSGKMYYLHSKDVVLAAGRKQRIFYFAGEATKGSLDALPAGYEVFENERTGLPMLRKEGGAAKKPAAKKAAAKKPAAKKAAVKKPAAKKAAAKPAAKKPAAKKAVAKPAAKKPAAKKAAVKKPAAKKPAKKSARR